MLVAKLTQTYFITATFVSV